MVKRPKERKMKRVSKDFKTTPGKFNTQRIHSVNPKKEKTIYHMKKKFSKERERKKYQVILDLKYSTCEKKYS